MSGILVFVRHGQSVWNAENLFTGWRDPDLTAQGCAEAKAAGRALKEAGLSFDIAFTSALTRAQKTCQLLLGELGQPQLDTICDARLNERDYGALSGLNKDDARKKWGDEQVHIWRRSYDTAPPDGESLKDTAARVLPYFNADIKPRLRGGEAVLLVAHGNSLRAILMVLEEMSAAQITEVNIDTGAPYIYRFDADGQVREKQILARA